MKKNILTLAGIVSFLIVNYSMSLSIINETSFYAVVSVEHGDPQCFDYKEVLVKPQETVNITSSCPVKKISAVIYVGRNGPEINAAEYTEKSNPKARQVQGEFLERGDAKFRIVQSGKYSATGSFGVEKIQ